MYKQRNTVGSYISNNSTLKTNSKAIQMSTDLVGKKKINNVYQKNPVI